MSLTTIRHLEREARSLRAQLDEMTVSAREAYRAGWEAGRGAAVGLVDASTWTDREAVVAGLRALLPPVTDTAPADEPAP